MATANFEDFYEVPNLNFDISKLKDCLLYTSDAADDP